MNWSLNLDKRIPTPLRILLRGAGQVVFCNNAVTGLIVLAAFYAGGTITGLAATVGLISSTVTAHACRFCKADIEAGLYGFNGVLSGACLSIFLEHTPQLWLYIVLASMLSSLMWAVLTRMLQLFNMPAATSPFVLVSWVFLVTIYAFDSYALGPALPAASMQLAVMDIGTRPLETWFTALARGIGQVIFTDNTLAGGMLLTGIAIASLRGALMVIGGAFIGVVVPAILGVHASAIEAGLYGFNPALVMIAIGWVFLEPSAKSALLAILAGILAVLCQAVLSSLLTPMGLPVLASPFILTLWVVLFIASKSRYWFSAAMS